MKTYTLKSGRSDYIFKVSLLGRVKKRFKITGKGKNQEVEEIREFMIISAKGNPKTLKLKDLVPGERYLLRYVGSKDPGFKEVKVNAA